MKPYKNLMVQAYKVPPDELVFGGLDLNYCFSSAVLSGGLFYLFKLIG
jgi:hypothetical protein